MEDLMTAMLDQEEAEEAEREDEDISKMSPEEGKCRHRQPNQHRQREFSDGLLQVCFFNYTTSVAIAKCVCAHIALPVLVGQRKMRLLY